MVWLGQLQVMYYKLQIFFFLKWFRGGSPWLLNRSSFSQLGNIRKEESKGTGKGVCAYFRFFILAFSLSA